MLGILAGLGASIASSAVSAGINNANAQRANQVQREMQRDAMMFNKQQADIAYQRDSLANKVRQLREAGFSPSLAVDYNQNSNAPSVSAPSAHMANSPSVDATPFTSAVQSFQQREFDKDLQRAQVLVTLSQAGLNDKQKDLVNQQINSLFEDSHYKILDYMDRHSLNVATIDNINKQIAFTEKQLELEKQKFEHQKLDDAEKNRIQEKIGTYNESIKTFEYVRDLLSEFLSGSASAQEVIDKVVSAPQSVFDYFSNLYGGLKNFINSFNPGGSRHLDWSKYDKRSKGHSKVDRVHK